MNSGPPQRSTPFFPQIRILPGAPFIAPLSLAVVGMHCTSSCYHFPDSQRPPMTSLFVLWFALLTPQATTPATPPPSEPPASQPARPPAPATPTTPTPDQAAPAKPPSPNPDASGIYKSGGGVTTPKVLYQPTPEYSEIARKQKISGVAFISIIVDAQGNPVNVHITKSIADTVGNNKKKHAAALSLDQAALDAVKQYRFIPAMKDGKPVAVYLNVEVNFQVSGIYKGGDGVTPPKLIHRVDPIYSKIARKQKITGITTVSIIIDTQGNPTNAHISKSIADSVDQEYQAAALSLDQAALDAVKQYKFTPAMKDGKPVPVYLNVEVNFRIY